MKSKAFNVLLSICCAVFIIMTLMLVHQRTEIKRLKEENKWRDYYGWIVKYEPFIEYSYYPMSSGALQGITIIGTGGLENLVRRTYPEAEVEEKVRQMYEIMEKVEKNWADSYSQLPGAYFAAQNYFRYGYLPDFGAFSPKEYEKAIDEYILLFTTYEGTTMSLISLLCD